MYSQISKAAFLLFLLCLLYLCFLLCLQQPNNLVWQKCVTAMQLHPSSSKFAASITSLIQK